MTGTPGKQHFVNCLLSIANDSFLQFPAQQFIILLTGQDPMFIAVRAGFIRIAEGTLADDNVISLTNGTSDLAGRTTIDIIVLGEQFLRFSGGCRSFRS